MVHEYSLIQSDTNDAIRTQAWSYSIGYNIGRFVRSFNKAMRPTLEDFDRSVKYTCAYAQKSY